VFSSNSLSSLKTVSHRSEKTFKTILNSQTLARVKAISKDFNSIFLSFLGK
jgi:hypothetical protein